MHKFYIGDMCWSIYSDFLRYYGFTILRTVVHDRFGFFHGIDYRQPELMRGRDHKIQG